LLRETWRAGIETVGSCQGDDGQSYVEFDGQVNVTEFYRLVQIGGPSESMYARMGNGNVAGYWRVSVFMAEYHDTSRFRAWLYILKFPHSDIDEITACLKRGREVLIT
jgi:hypothetical protein